MKKTTRISVAADIVKILQQGKYSAKIFWKLLGTDGAFYGRFKKIQFSVFDRTKDKSTFKAFQNVFLL